MNIDQSQRQKYKEIWERTSYRSRSAVPFAYQLMDKYGLRGPALEIGCGDGTTMGILQEHGMDVQGCDITLAGYRGGGPAKECPAWDLPYKDKRFACTFSTDVLEHIPIDKIEDSVREIVRVTKWLTIHQVATFPMGSEHLTVKPIEWWKDLFEGRGIRAIILERQN